MQYNSGQTENEEKKKKRFSVENKELWRDTVLYLTWMFGY